MSSKVQSLLKTLNENDDGVQTPPTPGMKPPATASAPAAKKDDPAAKPEAENPRHMIATGDGLEIYLQEEGPVCFVVEHNGGTYKVPIIEIDEQAAHELDDIAEKYKSMGEQFVKMVEDIIEITLR